MTSNDEYRFFFSGYDDNRYGHVIGSGRAWTTDKDFLLIMDYENLGLGYNTPVRLTMGSNGQR